MAYKGNDDVRNKIVINGNNIEQVNVFKYLENEILYEREIDISRKIAKFLRVTRLIIKTLME